MLFIIPIAQVSCLNIYNFHVCFNLKTVLGHLKMCKHLKVEQNPTPRAAVGAVIGQSPAKRAAGQSDLLLIKFIFMQLLFHM